jgi:hypothetical protein
MVCVIEFSQYQTNPFQNGRGVQNIDDKKEYLRGICMFYENNNSILGTCL